MNRKKEEIKYSQHTTKKEMDKWLLSGDKKWIFCFNYGADDLGSPWRSEIPVTPLLLAGLKKGKVKIYAEYNWHRLVGGFTLRVELIEAVTKEDLEGIIITREQKDKYMQEKYASSKKRKDLK